LDGSSLNYCNIATAIPENFLEDRERIKFEPDPLTPALSQRERVRMEARKIKPFRG
jgi:hypothetical protein